MFKQPKRIFANTKRLSLLENESDATREKAQTSIVIPTRDLNQPTHKPASDSLKEYDPNCVPMAINISGLILSVAAIISAMGLSHLANSGNSSASVWAFLLAAGGLAGTAVFSCRIHHLRVQSEQVSLSSYSVARQKASHQAKPPSQEEQLDIFLNL